VPSILLIDDHAMQLCIRASLLRDAGFSVISASTPAQALAALRASEGAPVDAVVTDYLMPGIRGSELVQALRALSPHIPVIALSGLPEAEPEYAGLDVIFLRKPCPPAELIQQLRACLRVKALANHT
jgi:CheY-like chemotaxis protein